MSVAELAVVLFIVIPLAAVVGGVFLAALRILRGGSKDHGRLDAEEARTIQDIYHNLQRMEERIESLETILLDHERKGTPQ